MWDAGNSKDIEVEDSLERLKMLKGTLTDEVARIELMRLFRSNLRWAAKVILGVKLFPYQEIVLKAMFRKDFPLVICSRGFGKTFMGAVFCCLYPLFNQGKKIVVLAPSFKQSKLLFAEMERIISRPEAKVFRDVIGDGISHGNDEYSMKIGTSELKALPLGSGEKIRGFRANVIIIDEYVAMPPSIIQEVIEPFLVVNSNVVARQEIYDKESELIKAGAMKESERTKFENPKLIGLTSASYKFQFLYNTYLKYIEAITDPSKKGDETYAVLQMSYQTVPSQYMSEATINKAKKTISDSQFKREYGAEFTEDSSGYFSMMQMEGCTVADGLQPSIELWGDKNAEYILAIDPNYKEANDSDHFAMCLVKLDKAKRIGYVVHNYALSGATLKDHALYLYYILNNFNVVYIIADAMGIEQVLTFANENALFKGSKIELKDFEGDFDSIDGIKLAQKSYSKQLHKIVHKQYFSSDWIRNANQELQAAYQHKRIWFGSKYQDEDYRKLVEKVALADLKFNTKEPDKKYTPDNIEKIIDFIDNQRYLMKLVKDECAMIEVTSSPLGTQSFDLPQTMKRETGSDRPRKDSYTAILLANWGVKCYFSLFDVPQSAYQTFVPFFV